MDNLMERIRLISERLKKEYKAERIILFGSYAKKKQTLDSDIDLFIIAPSKERFYERMATALRITRDLHQNIPISPIVLTPDEFEKRKKGKDEFINEILENGIDI